MTIKIIPDFKIYWDFYVSGHATCHINSFNYFPWDEIKIFYVTNHSKKPDITILEVESLKL